MAVRVGGAAKAFLKMALTSAGLTASTAAETASFVGTDPEAINSSATKGRVSVWLSSWNMR